MLSPCVGVVACSRPHHITILMLQVTDCNDAITMRHRGSRSRRWHAQYVCSASCSMLGTVIVEEATPTVPLHLRYYSKVTPSHYRLCTKQSRGLRSMQTLRHQQDLYDGGGGCASYSACKWWASATSSKSMGFCLASIQAGPLTRQCDECRSRKTRCDRASPCSHCRAAGLTCRTTTQRSKVRSERIHVTKK